MVSLGSLFKFLLRGACALLLLVLLSYLSFVIYVVVNANSLFGFSSENAVSMNRVRGHFDLPSRREVRFVNASSASLHVEIFRQDPCGASGDENSVHILWLHGFPEGNGVTAWGPQLEFFARECGQVQIVPDLRGYGLSTMSPDAGVSDFDMQYLIDDILRILNDLSLERAILVSHDWGAAIAWEFGRLYPERVQRLCIINCARSDVMGQQLYLGNWEQIRASWYVYFFQMPIVPEYVLLRNNAEILRKLMSHQAPELLDSETRIWSQTLTSMINYYRAAIRTAMRSNDLWKALSGESVPPVKVDTLMLWGEQDVALRTTIRDLSFATVTGRRAMHNFPKAGHWVHWQESERINDVLSAFFKDEPRWLLSGDEQGIDRQPTS